MSATFRFRLNSATPSTNRLVEHVKASGAFQKVYRAGDKAAAGVPDLVTLHTKMEGFKEGSQTRA